ncbi:MAG: OmpA family protein [Bacteroidales bacterium]|nr:OmpA family protein [Bacteroidales bacterium]
MMKVLRYSTILLFGILTLSSAAKTQDDSFRRAWYVGAEAGVPFSLNSFSSFAPSGVYGGATFGLSAGYRFSPLLSLEADLGLGRTNLAAQAGCLDNNYYFASDGLLYFAKPLGMDSWNVSDFRSRVSYARIGLSVNFDLLSLYRTSASRRWALDLSPRIAAYSTRAAFIPFSSAEALPISQSKGSLHFGYGASMRASYRLSESFSLGLKSSLTALGAQGIDGIPDHGHKSNLVWENTLQLSYAILPSSRKSSSALKGGPSGKAEAIQRESQKGGSLNPCRSRRVVLSEGTTEVLGARSFASARNLPSFDPRKELPQSQSVYFAFDKWDLRREESSKLLEILEALRSDSALRLSLEGWCDRYGSEQVNMIISSLRAESVKKWFISKGIDASRIEVTGRGIDRNESNNAKARRVQVQLSRAIE